MRTVNGSLLVVVGLVVLYLAITGKLERVGDAWRALTGGASGPSGGELPTDAGDIYSEPRGPGGRVNALAGLDPLSLPTMYELPSFAGVKPGAS